MQRSVYLAGKIGKHDWREDIVGPAINVYTSCSYSEYDDPFEDKLLKNTVFGMDYAGPFFFGCDHGCNHGDGSHGVDANGSNMSPVKHLDGLSTMEYARERTLCACLQQIKRADIVFAWIDDPTCHGTIAEIGYAKALNKTIWIAGPHEDRDFWFVYEMATEKYFEYWMNPKLALQMLLTKEAFNGEQAANRVRSVN